MRSLEEMSAFNDMFDRLLRAERGRGGEGDQDKEKAEKPPLKSDLKDWDSAQLLERMERSV